MPYINHQAIRSSSMRLNASRALRTAKTFFGYTSEATALDVYNRAVYKVFESMDAHDFAGRDSAPCECELTADLLCLLREQFKITRGLI